MPIPKERPRFDELQDTTGACRPLEHAVSELLRWQKNNQITGIDRVKYLLTKWPVEGGLVLSNGANLHTLIGLTPESTRELKEVGWERYFWRTGTHLEWKPKKQIMAVSVGKRKMEIFLGETEWGKGTSPDFYRPISRMERDGFTTRNTPGQEFLSVLPRGRLCRKICHPAFPNDELGKEARWRYCFINFFLTDGNSNVKLF